MKTCGIICEYNPFHYGHRYQIEETKKKCDADVMIGIMSGNFVQRGEPAIIDKWTRAEAAVQNGLDVVIELPFLYSIQAASHFAHGGVHLLKLCHCDYISFGSECGNIENLQDIANTSINPDHLRQMMADGLSYPKAYSLLTSSMAPNDILAVSYLKEIKDTDIKPVIIQRTGGYLDETIKENASAMAIRKALLANKDLCHSTPMEEALCKYHVTMEQFYPYIRNFLILTPSSALSSFFLFSEGIENHLKENAVKCETWNEFLNSTTTYRYTSSRIRRCLLSAMLQIKKEQAASLSDPDTVRILAFNNNGRKWLSENKEQIKIASRFAKVPEEWRKIELQATYLYTSVLSSDLRNRLLKEEIQGAHYLNI